MTDRWTYADYQRAVSSAVHQATTQLGFNIDQAVGYAHVDLALRLDECPTEAALALTALAGVLLQDSDPKEYSSDWEFVQEIRAAYSSSLDQLLMGLGETDRREFIKAANAVKAAFGI